MKHLFVTILLFAHYQAIWGQTDPRHRLLQTDSKAHHYYVDLNDAEARVFAMGYHAELAVSGPAIIRADTLQKQPDSSYSGRYLRIIREKDELYLLRLSKRSRKFRLNTVSDTNFVNDRLNNAYYLDRYFMMCEKLNYYYPLNYLDPRAAFLKWKELPGSERSMPYLQFKVLADERFEKISDSITAVQGEYVRLTNNIVDNIRSWNYATLKDSLIQLPPKYMVQSTYYGTVIDSVALQRPEYFFRLAEDLPEQRSLIFMNGIDNRRALPGLLGVEGHDEMKRGFLKERRSEKISGFFAIGSTVSGFALLGWLIIAIF